MKYIDSEKLLAEIERRREKCADIAADEKNEEVAEYYRGKEVAYDETSSLINSLQQEQPDGYNRAMIEVKAKVDELYDETSIGLSEYDAGFYNGIIETCMKLRGFIKARISKDQPEVDLEKEITPYFVEHLLCEFGVQSISDMDGENLAEFARHFYELGRLSNK